MKTPVKTMTSTMHNNRICEHKKVSKDKVNYFILLVLHPSKQFLIANCYSKAK